MKKIRSAWLVGFVTVGILSALAGDDSAVKKDMAQLQGEWSNISIERDGQSFPGGKDSKRVAKGNETTVTINGQLFMKAKFTLDPSKQPKAIDYEVTGGPYTGKRQLGIYELEGDTVKFCFAIPGKDRPTEFQSRPDDGRTVSVWKRVKP